MSMLWCLLLEILNLPWTAGLLTDFRYTPCISESDKEENRQRAKMHDSLSLLWHWEAQKERIQFLKNKRKMCCTIQALRELCIVDHKTVERLILFFSILLIRRDLYTFLDLWQLCFFIQKLTPFSAFAALTKEGWKMSGMTDAEGASRRFVMTWLFYERKNGSWCHVTIFKKRQRYVFVI